MNILISLVVAVVTVSLSGCATFNDLSKTSADELLPKPGVRVLHADVSASGGFVCGITTLAATSTPSEIELFERARYCAIIEDDEFLQGDTNKQFFANLSRSYLSRFVRQGMVLADAHCEVFLDAMEGKRVLTEFNISNFNILAGVATLAMSKLGNHPQSLFNLATGATAVNSFSDNYKANFLLTGTMHQLRDAVKQYRGVLASASNLASPDTYTSFAEAQGDLREYASVCTHKGLVHLVNTKLANTKFEAGNLDKTAGDRIARLLITEAKASDASIKKEAFAAGEFETLYELVVLPSSTRTKLLAKLYAGDKKLLKEKLPTLWQIIVALGLEKDVPRSVDDIVLAGKLLGYPLGKSDAQRILVAGLVTTNLSAAEIAAATPLNTSPGASSQSLKRNMHGTQSSASTVGSQMQVVGTNK